MFMVRVALFCILTKLITKEFNLLYRNECQELNINLSQTNVF